MVGRSVFLVQYMQYKYAMSRRKQRQFAITGWLYSHDTQLYFCFFYISEIYEVRFYVNIAQQYTKSSNYKSKYKFYNSQ